MKTKEKHLKLEELIEAYAGTVARFETAFCHHYSVDDCTRLSKEEDKALKELLNFIKQNVK
ncbi:hypothetical protein [Escherichia phage CLB_P2]|nr:hypothetical protein [Escherichia phage CLB_P2]